ncbi:MAG: nucleotidyltransferase domain-containing protein [Nanoarchaeota archaeon]|nr:nucleotidyltransferase domain-containing protein [Nanoarchaeota archaeon]
METIMNKGIKNILNLFYNNQNEKFHLREISRKTNLNENSVTRFLNKLEKAKLIKSKKRANLKEYSISKNKKLYSIFNLFDLEKYNSLPMERKQAIEYFIKKLENQPLITLLFGSTAKNNFREDSDIDLLLITNGKINLKKAKDFSESQTGIKISSFQISFEEFKEELKLKKDKVIQSAIETGYPIENSIKFYSEVLNE